MNYTKKCELCDVALEFNVNGHRAVFTAHTPEFCRAMTIDRIRMLQAVIQQNADACQRSIEKHRRRIDQWLKDHGNETLTAWTEQMSREAEIKMAQARALALGRPDIETAEDRWWSL